MADQNDDQDNGSLPTPSSNSSDDTETEIPFADLDIQSVISGKTTKPIPEEMNVPVVDAPEIADDNDLIEKDWVNKAKNILAKTKSDPHSQSDEITMFKADYIKKRYNKTIKTGE